MSYHRDIGAPYSCEPCSMYFKTKRSLASHNRSIHPAMPHQDVKVNVDLRCELCNEQCRTEQELGTHYRELHDALEVETSDVLCAASEETLASNTSVVQGKPLRTYQRKPKNQPTVIKEEVVEFLLPNVEDPSEDSL